MLSFQYVLNINIIHEILYIHLLEYEIKIQYGFLSLYQSHFKCPVVTCMGQYSC